MRTAYKILAYLIAIEVAIQAMAMVFAVAGLGKWIDEGGVLNKAAFESGESLFPEEVGFIIHGMNGMMVIPALALLLLIVSFFTRLPGAVKFAGLVLLLVVLQVALGIFGHGIPALGALHGLNALLLLGTALTAARRAGAEAEIPAEADTRLATST
jgi:hypothetical protein